MTNFLVSNYSLLSSPRSAVSKIQQELTIMQKQATTGRLADVGLTLGLRTNQSISLRSESEGVDRQLDTNAILSQRFSVMQNALQSIADTGEAFQKSLIANGTGEAGIAADMQQAMASLQGLMGALNSSSGSRFLFSGAATDQAAISFPATGGGTADTYFAGSVAQDATATAFAATFGYAQDDAAVSSMTPAELEAFLDGPFDDLFATGPGGGWTDNWSNADDGTVENRISGSETIKTSYSSNEAAFRNIAKAYVMLADLGAGNMTDEAAAVSLIAAADRPERTQVLADFYDKWRGAPLVVNKWLAWQAISGVRGTLARIEELTGHEAFDIKNPNKVRALVGAFAMENLGAFHSGDGAGYDFFFARIRELDPLNPQVAARLLTATENWRRLEPGRQALLKARLDELKGTSGLSKNVYEMATRLAE